MSFFFFKVASQPTMTFHVPVCKRYQMFPRFLNLFVGGMSVRDQTPVLSFNSLFVVPATSLFIQTQPELTVFMRCNVGLSLFFGGKGGGGSLTLCGTGRYDFTVITEI